MISSKNFAKTFGALLSIFSASTCWTSLPTATTPSKHIQRVLQKLETKPFMIFWGMKGKFIPATQLEKWKSRLPKATVVVYDDAGHFVQEEKPAEMVAELTDFMKS
ncbi:MAG TPA: alpha/beta hydrolase [Cyclobacteriaceae bacterium]